VIGQQHLGLVIYKTPVVKSSSGDRYQGNTKIRQVVVSTFDDESISLAMKLFDAVQAVVAR